jgi:hypothetical protein
MRSILNLKRELNRKNIEAVIVKLEGDCLGIVHKGGQRGLIMDICELLGYSFIRPHEYEYTYKNKPVGDIIIF